MCWVGWLCVLCLLAQWCLTLCDPVDYSPPGSSVRADSPGKNTGVGCHALLQGIFPTQGLNPHLLHCRQILYCLRCQVSPLPNSCLFQEPQKGNLSGNKVTADVRDLGEVILGLGGPSYKATVVLRRRKAARGHGQTPGGSGPHAQGDGGRRRVSPPQAKEHQGLLATPGAERKAWSRLFPSPFRGTTALLRAWFWRLASGAVRE